MSRPSLPISSVPRDEPKQVRIEGNAPAEPVSCPSQSSARRHGSQTITAVEHHNIFPARTSISERGTQITAVDFSSYRIL